ncbi:MAG TPA: 2,3-diaminopropionate biosynthesis protein SbnA [Pyrinomonadaceae bacterium]|jgi:cysteine synthase A
MNDGILSTIGNTPLVRLRRIIRDLPFELYGKLEAFNPGGSTKDRPALNIITHGVESGEINSETVVIESSSGNMGIGLAQACAYHGLRFICVIDPKTTLQNIRLLEVYGAQVDLVSEPDPLTGEYLQARIDRVQELLSSTAHSFWPNQYANTYNNRAHRRTMSEIVTALGREPDYLFCATSTCGTLRGCSEYIREHKLKTKIFAVDAEGSVIFGGKKAKRLIPGHGASMQPQLYHPDLHDVCVHVNDLDCVVGCRRLVRLEALLAGGSSGAVMMAVERISPEIPRDAICVAIFPDRGERYLDTIYSDEWVRNNFGEVEHLWQDTLVTQS